jgi:hypothetical protein
MPHPDLEELLNALIPFAQEMLAKHGEFYPFGASVSAKGEIACVAGEMGEEQPDTKEVIDLLVKGLGDEASRGEIRAAAICYDVRIVPPEQTEQVDAIAVRTEHQNGEAIEAYLPYRKAGRGKYEYDELFAIEGERGIFPEQKSSK